MSLAGLQAKMLCSDGRSSSKALWIVGTITVTSADVYVGFSGIGFDLYVQWLMQ
jgi:hypothetical protein